MVYYDGSREGKPQALASLSRSLRHYIYPSRVVHIGWHPAQAARCEIWYRSFAKVSRQYNPDIDILGKHIHCSDIQYIQECLQ